MTHWAIVAACFCAVAIGWFLGRMPLSTIWRWLQYRTWRKSYMQGLNFLLNEESDQAIESLIRSWDVNADNFDLHNALANMLRRKGEVDRAIPIHANLLSIKLPKAQTRLATIELAKDYIAAGLLDRAERLLINVVNNSTDFEEKSLELLQQVYQLEKDWDKAITIAEQLVPKRRLSFNDKSVNIGKHNSITAQYYCELATEALVKDSFKTAERLLDKALNIDKKCARATLLKARLLQERGELKLAVQVLDELTQQDPLLLVEALDTLQRCYGDDKAGLIAHLHQWLKYFPSVQIQKTLFENLQPIDPGQASEFLLAEIQKRPTIIGLKLFLEQQALFDTGTSKEAISLLRQLMEQVLKDKTAYLCSHCGFSGSQLHWLCPQCQSWDSIRRIRGSEGD